MQQSPLTSADDAAELRLLLVHLRSCDGKQFWYKCLRASDLYATVYVAVLRFLTVFPGFVFLVNTVLHWSQRPSH